MRAESKLCKKKQRIAGAFAKNFLKLYFNRFQKKNAIKPAYASHV
jgi:hypothetical protein